MPFRNPVLLVTGASRGIGHATCLLAAERGYGVVVNYAEIAKAAGALVERIESRGGEALAIRADVSSETAIRLMFAEIARKAGPLQQVNCAGSVRRRPSGRRYRRIASTG